MNLEKIQNKLEREMLEDVNKDGSLQTYIENMSKGVRLSGSQDEAAAFAYAQAEMEKLGLKTQLLYGDAYISWPLSAQITADGKAYPAITHSMAAPTAGTTAELIYLGKAAQVDYSQCDVQGKIVMLNGLSMGANVKNAQDAGAAAVIFINAEYTNEGICSYVWGSPTPADLELLPKIPVASVNYATGLELQELLKAGKSKITLETQVKTEWMQIPTLIAELEGTVEKDKYLLMSGHIDSWHLGALDNGAGTAVMLETARILSKHREQLRRSVRFAFWSGHSHGRYAGSTWYCDHHFEDLYDNCFLHVNSDCLGGVGSTIMTEGNCMPETRELGGKVIKELTGQDYEGARFTRSGDQSLWGTGTPSLFMGLSEQPLPTEMGVAAEAFAGLFGGGKTGGFGWWWHTEKDTLEIIDMECLVRDCSVYLLSVFRACSAQVIPIDHLSAVKAMRADLEEYAAKVGDKLDMSLTLSRINELCKAVNFVFNECDYCRGTRVPPTEADKEWEELFIIDINETSMELSRILVPLSFVRGNIYEHDTTLKAPHIPLLEEINKLAELEQGSDAFKSQSVLVRRRLNQVNHALLKAIRLLGEGCEC